jgi:hypothetical protein
VKKDRIINSALTAAGILGAFGLMFLAESFYAKLTHGWVRAGRPGAGPLTPNEGLVVAGLFFAVAAYALFLAYRARNNTDDEGSGD